MEPVADFRQTKLFGLNNIGFVSVDNAANMDDRQ
jgi:hypothetical protein